MTNISSEDNIYGFCDPNLFRVGYISSNMNISNCSRVRTSHPPRYHYIGPYINNQQRKNFIREFWVLLPTAGLKEDFVLVGENIEEVESFVYLGSLINIKGSSAQEIRRRLAMGRGAVQNMVSIWKSRGMSLGLKVRFLRANAFPIAIYGCESWVMTSGDKKRVDAFELWCYRRLLRVSWVESKTNKWVLEEIGSVLMLRKSMAERKMRFFGHIVRKNGMEKRLMQGKVEGTRRRGRPTTAWFQDLKEWTKLNIAAASQLATDRERWREIIKVTAAQIAPPD